MPAPGMHDNVDVAFIILVAFKKMVPAVIPISV
jgi:hypothetical protein